MGPSANSSKNGVRKPPKVRKLTPSVRWGLRTGAASPLLDWEHPEGRGRECSTRLGTLRAEDATSHWELPEYWIGPLFPPLRPGPSLWLWDTKVLRPGHLESLETRQDAGGAAATAWDRRGGPPAQQEGRARNHIPVIRSFPLLPLLPRGGVGMGFIAGVWGQDFTSLMAS